MTTTQPHFVSIMKTLASRCFGRPWQALLLLLIGMPVVWAAGVSISNLTINTFKQVSFAEAEVGVDVGAKVTRTATIKYSTGTVSYSSGNAAIATVNAQTGEVTGVQPGETTIIATQAAKSPYPQATASYKIKVNGKPVTFADWALPSVVFSEGLTFQLSPTPTSDVPGTPTITYSTLDNDTSVVSITPAGLVTVKGKGTATIVATQAPLGEYNGGTTQATLEVTAATPTFSWSDRTVSIGSTLTLEDPTDSPNQAGAFSYTVNPDSTGRNLATIAGKVLTPIAAGTTTLTVTQAAAGNYAAASQTVALTIEPSTVTITGFTLADRTFDPFVPSNNSFDLPVLNKPLNSSSEYVFTSSDPSIATINGRTVNILKYGTVTITAALPADPLLHNAATANATLTIHPALPQITLNDVIGYTNQTTYTIPVASANVSTPVQLALKNANPAGFASLAFNNGQWTATIAGAGTAQIEATQVASDAFAAGSATATLTVIDEASLQANPLALANFEKRVGDLPFKPEWSGAIGDATTIEVSSSEAGIATVGADNQTITLTGATGTSQIRLRQPAQNGYRSADVAATLTVRPAAFEITGYTFADRTFDAVDQSNNVFDIVPPVKPQGSASSFVFTSSDETIATVNGTTVTVHKPGAVTITAMLAADPRLHDAASVSATLTILPAEPRIVLANISKYIGDGPFTVDVSSNNTTTPITLSLENANPPGFVTLADNNGQWTATIQGVGTAELVARQEASASGIFGVGSARATLVVADPGTLQANPLTLTDIQKYYNEASFKPNWTNAVGDTSSIVVTSSDQRIATVGADGQTITLTGKIGTTQIGLYQPAQGGYRESSVTATLTVSIRPFQITGLGAEIVREFDSQNNVFELPELLKPAGSTSEFVVTSSDETVATVSGRQVTIHKAGSTTIKVALPADPARHSGAEASVILTVNRAITRIYLPDGILVDVGVPVRFTVGSNHPGMPDLSVWQLWWSDVKNHGVTIVQTPNSREWVVTPNEAGTYTVKVEFPDTENYIGNVGSFNISTQAGLVTQENTLTLANFTKFTLDAPFIPEWENVVGSASEIRVSSSNSAVATVGEDNQTISLTGRVGSTEITLRHSPRGYENKEVTARLDVLAGQFTITGLSDITRTYDPANNAFDLPTLTKPAGSSSTYSFISADRSVASISGQRVQIHKAGTTSIQATLPADPLRHEPAATTFTLTVNKAAPVITLSDIDRSVGTAPAQVPVTSTSPAAIELQLQNATVPGFATLSRDAQGNWTATPYQAGEAELVATQAATESYNGASVTKRLKVWSELLKPNTLALNPISKLSIDAPFKPAWINPVGDPSTIVVSSSNLDVAVVGSDNQTILLTGRTGTSQITLTQGIQNSFDKTSVSATLTVTIPTYEITGLGDLSRTFDAINPANNLFELPRLAKPAGSASSYTFVSGDESIASISGNWATVLKPGQTTITAILAEDPVRHAEARRQVNLDVLPAVPTLNVQSVNAAFTGAGMTVELNTFSNSTAPIDLSLSQLQPAGFATVSRNAQGRWIATITEPGTATLNASQPAIGPFTEGTATASFRVLTTPLIANTLSLDDFEATVGDGEVAVPWGNLNNTAGPIVIESADPTIASVTATNRLMIHDKAGKTRITLSQAESNGYTGAHDIQATLTVRAGPVQTPSIQMTLPARFTFGDSFEPVVSTNSDGAVKLSVSDPTVASVDSTGKVISIVGIGPVTIKASVGSTAAFATVSTEATITTEKAAAGLIMNDLSEPMSSSVLRLPITTLSDGVITVTSSHPDIAEGVAATPPDFNPGVQLKGVPGTVTLTIQQAEGTHHKASEIVRTLVLRDTNKTPSIGWALINRLEVFAAARPFVWVLPEAVSDNTEGAITYSAELMDRGSTRGASFDPATRTLTLTGADGAGTYADHNIVLKATQAASPGFNSANYAIPVYIRYEPNPHALGLSPAYLVVQPVPARRLSEGPFQLSISTTSTADITISNYSGGPVSIDQATKVITPLTTGRTILHVAQAQTATHRGSVVSVEINVVEEAPIRAFDPIRLVLNDVNPIVPIPAPESPSFGEYTYEVEDTSIAEVQGQKIKLKQAGSTRITVRQAAMDPYGADSAQTDLHVMRQPSELSFGDTQPIEAAANATVNVYTVAVTSRSTGPIRYVSSNPSVATVTPINLRRAAVTLTGVAGTAEIIATQDATSWYDTGRATLAVTVKEASQGSGLALKAFSLALDATDTTVPYQTKDPAREVVIEVADTSYASVDPVHPRRLTLHKTGQVAVTVTHPRTATQPLETVSAFLTITQPQPPIGNLPTHIDHVWGSGQPTEFTLSPTPAGGIYTVTSSNPAVVSVDGMKLTLTGIGDAYVQVVRAASSEWAPVGATIPVRVTAQASTGAVEPHLVFTNRSVPSTTFELQLEAFSNNTATPITYALVSSSPADIATVSENGVLRVMGTGTVQVEARQAAASPAFLAKTVQATVTINPGLPAVEITYMPTTVNVGDLFQVRYRTNDVGLFGISVERNHSRGVGWVLHQPPATWGAEGVIWFKAEGYTDSEYRWVANGWVGLGYWGSEKFQFQEQLPEEAPLRGMTINPGPGVLLEGPVQIPFGHFSRAPRMLSPQDRSIVMGYCSGYVSSDTSKVGVVRNYDGTPGFVHHGTGTVTVSCAEYPNLTTEYTVVGTDPTFGDFPLYQINVNSKPMILKPPASNNTGGTWAFSVISQHPDAGTGPVIELTPEGQLTAVASGSAKIRATQAGSGGFNAGYVETVVKVAPLQLGTFAEVMVTYGDNDFDMPKPASDDLQTPFTFSITNPANQPTVATITESGRVTIVNAGVATVTATQGNRVFTGTLRVRKAQPRLTFTMGQNPPPTFRMQSCDYYEDVRFPKVNETNYESVNGEGHKLPGAMLTTDSDGQIRYLSSGGLFGGWGSDYYRGQVGNAPNYTFNGLGEENAVTFHVWVQQAETHNYFGATSPGYQFRGWVPYGTAKEPGLVPLLFSCSGPF